MTDDQERQGSQRVGDPDAGVVDPAADDPAAGIDAQEFARAGDEREGSEAGLGGGEGDPGGGGDLAGDSAGLDAEGDERTPA